MTELPDIAGINPLPADWKKDEDPNWFGAELADVFLKKHWDSSLPVPVKEMAEKEGFIIEESKELDVSGVLTAANKHIYLRQQDWYGRRNFTLAFLLGRFLLCPVDAVRFVSYPSKPGKALRTADRTAMAFARNVLMPEESFHELIECRQIETVSELADCFHVSDLVLRIRLDDFGAYTQEVVRFEDPH